MHIFKNKEFQLRSGWKILITLGTFFFIANFIGAILGIIYVAVKMATTGITNPEDIQRISLELSSDKTLNLALGILQSICMIGSVGLFWRVIDKKPLRDIGFPGLGSSYKRLGFGLVLGAASISVVFIILILSGTAYVSNELTSPNINISLVTGLLLFITVGFSEEIFSRGYCMTVLKQTRSRTAMIIISAVIFSIMHSLNPNIKPLGFVNIFLVGILFSYMVIKTGDIWMSIGYHITWNYFQGNIFGFEVSGQVQDGMYNTNIISENILNGGNFGPEGGLAVTIVILLGFIVLWKYFDRER